MSNAMLPKSRIAPSLDQLGVMDAMHPGVVTCPPETPIRDVAWMMSVYRIHAVVVYGELGDDTPELWGVVSDLDLVEAAAAGDVESRTAAEIAATPVLTVEPTDTLRRAAQMMAEHEVSHLVVVERASSRPLGVLSTLDVARRLGT
jgi:CBS domain-containing protein